MFGRQRIATIVAEFLGTSVLTLVFLSVQRSTIGIPYFIAIAAGAAVAVAAFFFSDSSGAHLNPAITLALWTARKISTLAGAAYIVAQLLGAWAAYGVYRYFVNSPIQSVGNHYSARVLFAEAIGAFVLALAWGATIYKRFDSSSRAIALGLSYTLAIIISASATGGIIGIVNPAVALGIRDWTIFGSVGWGTYLLGPVLGAIIGVNLYVVLFSKTSDSSVESVSETLIIAETSIPKKSSAKRSTTSAKAKKSPVKKTVSKKSSAKRR